MEVLGGGGGVGDADVAAGAHLEEALQARARVFRASPLVAVRQQQREPRELSPFGLSRHHELVDDGLGHVGEVAELRLPDDEIAVRAHAVAVLEAQHRGFRQRRVVDFEAGAAHGRQGRVRRAGFHVVEYEVAMAEGAALRVLPAEADGHALPEQRTQGESLGVGPVERRLLVEAASASVQLSAQLGVDGEPLRNRRRGGVDLREGRERDGRRAGVPAPWLRRVPVVFRRSVRVGAGPFS